MTEYLNATEIGAMYGIKVRRVQAIASDRGIPPAVKGRPYHAALWTRDQASAMKPGKRGRPPNAPKE